MKRISTFVLALALCLSFVPRTFAASNYANVEFLYPETHYDNQQSGQKRVPNGIPISSTVRVDGTGIDVHVGNVGVDGLDSVTVTVSATGYITPKSATYYVPPVIGKTFSFDFPFIVVNTTYSITIRIVDGSGTRTLYRTASLEYTDEILAAQGWGAGTYSSRTESLQKHFDKHHNDSGVNVNNIVAYLALAVATFNDTLNNPNDYRIVQQSGQTGFEAAHKYTHRTNHRFIIYGDNTDTIYSFGGR